MIERLQKSKVGKKEQMVNKASRTQNFPDCVYKTMVRNNRV